MISANNQIIAKVIVKHFVPSPSPCGTSGMSLTRSICRSPPWRPSGALSTPSKKTSPRPNAATNPVSRRRLCAGVTALLLKVRGWSEKPLQSLDGELLPFSGRCAPLTVEGPAPSRDGTSALSPVSCHSQIVAPLSALRLFAPHCQTAAEFKNPIS